MKLVKPVRENGRYRCTVCGAEIHVQAGETFPSCPSKDHTPKWVFSEERILTMAARPDNSGQLSYSCRKRFQRLDGGGAPRGQESPPGHRSPEAWRLSKTKRQWVAGLDPIKQRRARCRAAHSESGSPMATPSAISSRPSRITIHSILGGAAPSAMRRPISAVRRVTA